MALEFAKEMIDFSEGGENAIITDEVVERATKMAIDWLERVDLRSKMLDKLSPNWIDLSENSVSVNLVEGDECWFVAQPPNGGLPEKIKAKVVSTNPMTLENTQGAKDFTEYKPLYFIPKEVEDVIDKDFEPVEPKGVAIKNNKLSPTMPLRE